MNRRDLQIATIRKSAVGLGPARLKECYSNIRSGYESESSVRQLGNVAEELDRSPSGFRVLHMSETRRLSEFNDIAVHWDMYCTQLGRSVAFAERRYALEVLNELEASETAIDASAPNFTAILAAITDLRSRGYTPDTVCAPTALFVPFTGDPRLTIDWNASPREMLVVPGGPPLRLFWSVRGDPLDGFVVFDSSAVRWTVKPDPETGSRLTVAIGVPETQPNAVRFLAETVVKCEVQEPGACRAFSLEGEPRHPLEYAADQE